MKLPSDALIDRIFSKVGASPPEFIKFISNNDFLHCWEHQMYSRHPFVTTEGGLVLYWGKGHEHICCWGDGENPTSTFFVETDNKTGSVHTWNLSDRWSPHDDLGSNSGPGYTFPQ